MTYFEYTALGGIADCNSFPRLEMKARGLIDYRTQGRFSLSARISENVKLLTAEIIDRLYSAREKELTVTSESNDGVSKTYVSPDIAEKMLTEEINELIDTVMSELSYRGVD